MAGNLGDLWFQLGVKDNTAPELNKVLQKLTSINGAVSTLNKEWYDKVGQILSLNKKITAELDKQAPNEKNLKQWSDKVKTLKKEAAELAKGTDNALRYLGMLQRVQSALEKVGTLKDSAGKGANLSGLKEAETMLKNLRTQLWDIQHQMTKKGKDNGLGGVDMTTWLSKYEKLMSNVFRDVNKRMNDFKKDNSLSDAASRSARLETALERVKQKLIDIKTLQREAYANNYDRSNLTAAQNYLLGLQRRIEKMLKDPNGTKDIGAVDKLLSDVQVKSAKAATEIDLYTAAKKKAQATSISNKQDKKVFDDSISALTRINSLLGKTYEARNRGAALGMDVSRLNQDIQLLRQLRATLEAIRDNPSSAKTGKLIDAGTESRLANVKRHIKDIISGMSSARSRVTETTSAAQQLASAFDRVHNSASKTSSVLSDIKSLFLQGGIVFAAQQFANSIIKTGGDIVQQHVALRSILGDVQKADTLFAQTQQLALQSPFKFQELNRDVKQLAAFGVDTDRLYDTTKRLADVASGLGVSFERLGLAYGQVKSRSWLDGKELRQFAYAGLPMLQKIADLYNDTGKNGRRNYTTSDVRTMITKRQVSFEDVDKVFQRLTDEGGQFYNMQFVLSETLLGKWNKLEDAWTIMLGKFADGGNIIGDTFKYVIDAVTRLVQVSDQLSPMLLSFGLAFGGKSIIGGLQNKFGTGSIVKDMAKAQSIALANFSTRQLTRVAEGEISMQQARQAILTQKNLLASTEVKNQKYLQMAAEGKLSKFQLGRLAASGQISNSLIAQLHTTGLISRSQALLLLQAKQGTSIWSRGLAQMRLGVSGLWTSIKGLFTWTNAIFVGIGAVMSAVMSHEQKLSEMDSKADGVAGKYKNKASDLNETLNKVNHKVSRDSIKAMESALSKAGQLTDEVKSQVSEASSLVEKYNILRKKMEETLEMAKNLKDNDVIANALKASNGDIIGTPDEGVMGAGMRHIINAGKWISEHIPFTDKNGYASDNISKINELENAIKNLTQGMAGSFDSVDKALKKTTDAAHDSVFYEKVSKLPFEEKIQRILRSGYAQQFINNLNEVDSNAGWQASRLRDLLKSFDKFLQRLVANNVPNIVNELRRQMGLLGTDTSRWTVQQKNAFVLMFQQIMAAAGQMSAYVRGQVWKSFLASSELGQNLNPSGLRVVTSVNNNGKLYDTYLGQEGDDKKGHYVVVGWHRSRDGKHWEQNKIYNPAADKPDEPSPTGSNEDKKNKNHKDKVLEAFRNRVELYKKFYEEYKKLSDYVGSDRALYMLRQSGDFKTVFGFKLSDVTDCSKSLDQLTASLKGTTEERRKFLNDTIASKATKSREDLMKNIEQEVAYMNGQLEQFDARYDTYKKIVSATGNTDIANQVAFGRFTGDDVSPRTKRDMIKSILGSFYDYTPEDADSFLNLERKDAANKVGDKSGQFILWEANQKDTLKQIKDANDLYVDLVTKHQTIAEQIDAENRKYEDQLELLKKLNPSDYEQRKQNLTEDHEQTVGDLRFKQFKQDSGWEQIFRDLDRISIGTTKNLLSQLGQLLTTNNMSEESVKAIVEAMDKLREQIEKTSPLESIANGYHNLGLISQIRRYGGDGKGNYTLADEEVTALGLPKKKGNKYTSQDLDDAESNIFKGFENSIKGVQESFEALQGVLQPVTELLDTLGAKGMSQGFGIANKAFGSAASVAGGLNTLSQAASSAGMGGLSKALGAAGPYGAAAAAALSITSSILSMKTSSQKAYEKQAEYLKDIQSTTSSINKSLKSQLNQSSGSLAQIAGSKIAANYQNEANEVRKTYLSWSNAKSHRWGHRNRMKTGIDFDELNAFLYANGWTGELVNGGSVNSVGPQDVQYLSGKWLEKYREAHAGSWANINSEAKQYLERLIEIEGEEGELKETTDELNKAMTDFDSDTLKSEYRSLLDDLDSANEDFADNLEKHLRNAILSTMIANLYKTQIDELVSFAAKQADTKSGQYVSKNGTVKTHTGGDDTTDVMSEYTAEEYAAIQEKEQALAESMQNSRDYLKSLYNWSDSGSSSISSSAKGLSETTGDLLAAYANAMRGDISVIRQLYAVYGPKVDVTIQAQLQQLNMIAASTLRNADAAERIEVSVNNLYDLFNKSTVGSKQIGVKVY